MVINDTITNVNRIEGNLAVCKGCDTFDALLTDMLAVTQDGFEAGILQSGTRDEAMGEVEVYCAVVREVTSAWDESLKTGKTEAGCGCSEMLRFAAREGDDPSNKPPNNFVPKADDEDRSGGNEHVDEDWPDMGGSKTLDEFCCLAEKEKRGG